MSEVQAPIPNPFPKGKGDTECDLSDASHKSQSLSLPLGGGLEGAQTSNYSSNFTFIAQSNMN